MKQNAKEIVQDWMNYMFPSTTYLWEGFNVPAPKTTYLGINLTTHRILNMDVYTAPNSEGIARVTGDREVTLVVKCYGEDADLLLDLCNKMRTTRHIDYCWEQGIAFTILSGPNDITGPITASQWQQQGILELNLRYRFTMDDEVGVIETVLSKQI